MAYHQISTDPVHARIHVGEVYVYSSYTTAFTSTSPIDYVLSVASTQACHLTVEASVGSNSVLSLHEYPSVASLGTGVVAVNRSRRLASEVSATTVSVNPTIVAPGSVIFSRYVPGGQGGAASGGQDYTVHEVVLVPGETYLVRLQNIATSAAGSLIVHFYEPSDLVI